MKEKGELGEKLLEEQFQDSKGDEEKDVFNFKSSGTSTLNLKDNIVQSQLKPKQYFHSKSILSGSFKEWLKEDGLTNKSWPMYINEAVILKHQKNIEKLLDLNFGKDWRCYLELFYWNNQARHDFFKKDPTPIEIEKVKFKTRMIVYRNGHYSLATHIMQVYLNFGYEEAEKRILQDKYRFYWHHKYRKDNPPTDKGTIIVSNDLYDLVYGSSN